MVCDSGLSPHAHSSDRSTFLDHLPQAVTTLHVQMSVIDLTADSSDFILIFLFYFIFYQLELGTFEGTGSH